DPALLLRRLGVELGLLGVDLRLLRLGLGVDAALFLRRLGVEPGLLVVDLRLLRRRLGVGTLTLRLGTRLLPARAARRLALRRRLVEVVVTRAGAPRQLRVLLQKAHGLRLCDSQAGRCGRPG